MSYFNHLELPPAPHGDEVIWQYLSPAQLLTILNDQTLHFAPADRFVDPLSYIEDQMALNARSGIPPESTRRSFNLMKSVQSAVFTNSWYQSGSHAHFRWEIHGGNNKVAIRTSADALKKALSPSSQKISISSVQYIDFASVPMPTGNAFLPTLHQPHELRDEKEVQMLLLQAGGNGVFLPGPKGGVDVRIDAGSLIKGVRVSPQSSSWFRGLMRSIAERYSLNFERDNSTAESKPRCKFRTANGCSCPRRVRSVAPLLTINIAPPQPCTTRKEFV